MTNSLNTRELALDTLIEVMENNGLSHVVIGQTLSKYQYLDKKDRSFYTRLSEGTIENIILLDYIIDRFSNIQVKKMKPLIRNLLRTGVYQIMFMNSVPDSAACNESVKITIKRGFGALKGFVNGVLRNIARNKENINYPDASEQLIRYLSVYYSMPEWLVEKFIIELGTEETSLLLKNYGHHENKICVRCNTSKADIDEIIDSLKKDEVKVTKSPQYKNALYIEEYDYLEKLAAFKEGLIQVQDISSMLVACVAAPKEDYFIMDLCAAPGGKTLHLADMTHGKATILSRDISSKKIELINENINRAGFANIKTQVWDATVEDENYIEKADIVVADVPCSGFGIIEKKPDIKYKTSKEGCKNLVILQRNILKNAVKYVKKGGKLIYSTCTINKEENEENVKWIKENFDFDTFDISMYLPGNMKSQTMKDGYIQILPGMLNGDGFFIAGLIKKR